MTALSIQPTYPVFTDIDGSPLDAGYVYIGAANGDPLTPISVYWDEGLTQSATQPIRTIGGYPSNNGVRGRLYVNTDYSILVRDSRLAEVYSADSSTERYSNVVLSGGSGDVLQILAEPTGSSLIGYDGDQPTVKQALDALFVGAAPSSTNLVRTLRDGDGQAKLPSQIACCALPNGGIFYLVCSLWEASVISAGKVSVGGVWESIALPEDFSTNAYDGPVAILGPDGNVYFSYYADNPENYGVYLYKYAPTSGQLTEIHHLTQYSNYKVRNVLRFGPGGLLYWLPNLRLMQYPDSTNIAKIYSYNIYNGTFGEYVTIPQTGTYSGIPKDVDFVFDSAGALILATLPRSGQESNAVIFRYFEGVTTRLFDIPANTGNNPSSYTGLTISIGILNQVIFVTMAEAFGDATSTIDYSNRRISTYIGFGSTYVPYPRVEFRVTVSSAENLSRYPLIPYEDGLIFGAFGVTGFAIYKVDINGLSIISRAESELRSPPPSTEYDLGFAGALCLLPSGKPGAINVRVARFDPQEVSPARPLYAYFPT